MRAIDICRTKHVAGAKLMINYAPIYILSHIIKNLFLIANNGETVIQKCHLHKVASLMQWYKALVISRQYYLTS